MEEQMNPTQTAGEIPAVESDAAMEEHRAALAKMRPDYALEQLFASSVEKDAQILRRLIDVEQGDISIGADGVPDVSAVKGKIDALRRDKAYLFADAAGGQNDGQRVASAPRLGVMTHADASQMDDASYYRAVLGRKRAAR